MTSWPASLRKLRPPLLVLPLLLAAWATVERCTGPTLERPPPSTPAGEPDAASFHLPARPAPPCPVDTLPDRGLCVPLPPPEAAALDAPPLPAAL